LVLSGRATFTVGGDEIAAPAGTLVYISDPAAERLAVADEDGTVILSIGAPRAEDADAYAAYLEETGMRSARALPGSRGTLVLRRREGDRAAFETILLFDSLDDIRAFAGDDIERAVFFPDDDRFLVERELGVAHYEVDVHQGPESG